MGKGWQKPVYIDADKFHAIALALLRVLDGNPIKFRELVSRVSNELPNFEDSVSWYTLSVSRELESRGQLIRHTSPVRYSQATDKRD